MTTPPSPKLPEPFPPRIAALLEHVADRNPPDDLAPYEDENGEQLQDDADAALQWLFDAQSALQVQSEEIERLLALLADASRLLRQAPPVTRDIYAAGERVSFGAQAKQLAAAIDAARAQEKAK